MGLVGMRMWDKIGWGGGGAGAEATVWVKMRSNNDVQWTPWTTCPLRLLLLYSRCNGRAWLGLSLLPLSITPHLHASYIRD